MRFKFLLLWFAVTVAFEGYGFFRPGSQIPGTPFDTREAIQGAVLFGSLGVGVATCLTVGLFILDKVRHHRMRKSWAIACLAASSVASVIATPAVASLARDIPPWYVLGGEGGLAIVTIMVWMVFAASAGFLVFALLVLLEGRARE
jgi:hypothetical protein